MKQAWSPGWRMSGAIALLVPLLVVLGFWQLDRAAEKRAYLEDFQARQGALAVAPGLTLQEPAFTRVRLEGSYEPERYFLLDNQVRQGRIGYQVISSFLELDGRRWLVNRGWIAAPTERAELPEVSTPRGEQSLIGVYWPDLGLVPLLADDPWGEQWPKRVQRLNTARMAGLLENAVAAEIRLEGGQPGVFEPAEQLLRVSPQKHVGYAVQWFAMAVALAIAYLAYGFRRNRGHTE